MRIHTAIFAIVCLVSLSAFATPNKLIVKLEKGEDTSRLTSMGYKNIEPLVADLGIYAVEVPEGAARRGLRSVAADLRLQRGVVYAQEDHKVTMRATSGARPDDANFNDQWDMIQDNNSWGIDALGAWNTFGTAGLDQQGRDIVVAVVDGGVDIKHEDLAPNIWVNKGEIAGNNIDDDHNGYIDDVNGWNAFNDSGKVSSDRHGTHVAGTVGARGNNKLHGAGTNWNVKVMAISGASSQTSVVLKAYGYVLAQKKLWLESNGLLGANIVATNSSFGVDWADCKSKNYASWNDIYNEMGKVGILHAIATVNSNGDVDAKGDVPTSCDSPYIISVTNTQKDGKKYNSAAHGLKTIDIGAPGTDIFSTYPNNSWGTNTGTSMASPHVAGAVAYMHSVASPAFSNLYDTDPAAAALALKQTMLDTVTSTADLTGKTVSGGILNLNNAAKAISTLQ